MKTIIIKRIGSLFFGLLWIPLHGWTHVNLELIAVWIESDNLEGIVPTPGVSAEVVVPGIKRKKAESEIFDKMAKVTLGLALNAPIVIIARGNTYPGHCEPRMQLKEVNWRRKFLVLW